MPRESNSVTLLRTERCYQLRPVLTISVLLCRSFLLLKTRIPPLTRGGRNLCSGPSQRQLRLLGLFYLAASYPLAIATDSRCPAATCPAALTALWWRRTGCWHRHRPHNEARRGAPPLLDGFVGSRRFFGGALADRLHRTHLRLRR